MQYNDTTSYIKRKSNEEFVGGLEVNIYLDITFLSDLSILLRINPSFDLLLVVIYGPRINWICNAARRNWV